MCTFCQSRYHWYVRLFVCYEVGLISGMLCLGVKCSQVFYLIRPRRNTTQPSPHTRTYRYTAAKYNRWSWVAWAFFVCVWFLQLSDSQRDHVRVLLSAAFLICLPLFGCQFFFPNSSSSSSSLPGVNVGVIEEGCMSRLTELISGPWCMASLGLPAAPLHPD